MKKFSILFLVMLFFIPLDVLNAKEKFEGLYFGIGIDKINANVSANATMTSKYYQFGSLTATQNGSRSTNNASSEIGINYMVGYSWRFFNNLHIGTSLSGALNRQIAAGGKDYIADINPEFSLDGRIGYIFKNTLLIYGLAGFETAIANVKPYSLDDSYSNGGYPSTRGYNRSFTKTGTNKISGAKLGFGIEISTTENINTRLEYYQVKYANTLRSINNAHSRSYFYGRDYYLDDDFKFTTHTIRLSFIFT